MLRKHANEVNKLTSNFELFSAHNHRAADNGLSGVYVAGHPGQLLPLHIRDFRVLWGVSAVLEVHRNGKGEFVLQI